MKKIVALVAWAVLASSAFAEEAKLNLTRRDGRPLPTWAPSTAMLGVSVKNGSVYGTDEKGKPAVKFIVKLEPDWLADWVEVVDDGASIIIPTGPSTKEIRKIRVLVVAAKDNSITTAEYVCEVRDTQPNPNPNPGPKPDDVTPPAPSPVDPFANLTEQQKGIAQMVTKSVEWTAERRKTCACFAATFTKYADAAGRDAALPDPSLRYKSVVNLVKDTFEDNVKCQGADTDAWKTLFSVELKNFLEAKFEKGELPDVASHIRLWRDIAAAFNAVSQAK